MKRQRGRGRKPGNNSNRSFESNGPDVKVRGSASHIYDKYMQLARDATSSGDRVMAEAYYQHAEHYLRIVQANQANQPKPREDQGQSGGDDSRNGEGADEARNSQRESGDSENENQGGRNRNRRGRGRRRDEETVESSKGDASDVAASGDSSDPLQVVELAGSDASEATSNAEDTPQPEAPAKRTRTRRRKADSGADADAENALKAADSSDDAAA